MKIVFSLIAALAFATPVAAQDPAAIARMNAPGPEHQALDRRTGRWDVTATFQAAPDAAPQTVTGLVAERVMVGPFLQETLKPAPGSDVPEFTRIDYLGYDRVEGRWEYMSLDTRLPVGLMPAWSFDAGTPERIEMVFEPLGFVGFGEAVTGQMMRSDMTITSEGPDREVKEQRFVFADGQGRPYVASRYEYRRQ